MDVVAIEMVMEVLRREDRESCDRWGEGPGANSGSCCFLDPSCCFFFFFFLWSWCGHFRGHKFSLLHKIRKYPPSSPTLLYLPSLSLTLASAKTQTAHKSDPSLGAERRENLPLALLRAATTSIKHISRYGTFMFFVDLSHSGFTQGQSVG